MMHSKVTGRCLEAKMSPFKDPLATNLTKAVNSLIDTLLTMYDAKRHRLVPVSRVPRLAKMTRLVINELDSVKQSLLNFDRAIMDFIELESGSDGLDAQIIDNYPKDTIIQIDKYPKDTVKQIPLLPQLSYQPSKLGETHNDEQIQNTQDMPTLSPQSSMKEDMDIIAVDGYKNIIVGSLVEVKKETPSTFSSEQDIFAPKSPNKNDLENNDDDIYNTDSSQTQDYNWKSEEQSKECSGDAGAQNKQEEVPNQCFIKLTKLCTLKRKKSDVDEKGCGYPDNKIQRIDKSVPYNSTIPSSKSPSGRRISDSSIGSSPLDIVDLKERDKFNFDQTSSSPFEIVDLTQTPKQSSVEQLPVKYGPRRSGRLSSLNNQSSTQYITVSEPNDEGLRENDSDSDSSSNSLSLLMD